MCADLTKAEDKDEDVLVAIQRVGSGECDAQIQFGKYLLLQQRVIPDEPIDLDLRTLLELIVNLSFVRQCRTFSLVHKAAYIAFVLRELHFDEVDVLGRQLQNRLAVVLHHVTSIMLRKHS